MGEGLYLMLCISCFRQRFNQGCLICFSFGLIYIMLSQQVDLKSSMQETGSGLSVDLVCLSICACIYVHFSLHNRIVFVIVHAVLCVCACVEIYSCVFE
jgi:hypothetical protein